VKISIMLNAIAGAAAIVLSVVAVLVTLLWRAIELIIEIARTVLLIAIVAVLIAIPIALLWRAIGLIIEFARTALLIAVVALIALSFDFAVLFRGLLRAVGVIRRRSIRFVLAALGRPWRLPGGWNEKEQAEKANGCSAGGLDDRDGDSCLAVSPHAGGGRIISADSAGAHSPFAAQPQNNAKKQHGQKPI
jgi:hypothetical protein